MIIDVVKSKGIPFRCNTCNAYFAWKPDGHGGCRIRSRYLQCEKVECNYYTPTEKYCPECGGNDLTEVPVMVYKIIRKIRSVKWV